MHSGRCTTFFAKYDNIGQPVQRFGNDCAWAAYRACGAYVFAVCKYAVANVVVYRRIVPARRQAGDRLIKLLGENKFKYKSKLYKIPTPQFVVFYNGVDERPAKEVLRLSDAFMEESDHEKLGSLELEVVVYNINKGYNAEFLAKCPILRQYSDFIAKIREYEKSHKDYSSSVKAAVEYCIANDILANFLKKNGGKIVSILLTEFNEDDAREVWREEGIEEGIEKGMEKGKEAERLSFAKMLIHDKVPIDKIIQYTKFTHDEIKLLTSNL